MPRKSRDWSSLEQEGVPERVDDGSNSTVFKVIQEGNQSAIAVKEYNTLSDNVGVRRAKEILRQYHEHCIKAQELLAANPNPLNQKIEIAGEQFSLNYRIVAQGNLWFKGRKKAPLIAGQPFIGGMNLHDLNRQGIKASRNRDPDNTDPKMLVSVSHEQYDFLDSRIVLDLIVQIEALFEYLNRSMGTRFRFAERNVKPRVNYQEGKIEITITDLSDDLEYAYKTQQ